ncbi:hypothetical protein [Planctomyces sp. SH-PL14]|uniref:hypothetical protein n=1 Tax=Planctomyces sp. SH-PL14 TaxID=1632864 RepID=UPI00078DADDF|nr:hypothetical protein [Planctomyces sp. SH-PL14]AMV19181.1 hypothetical protein VT03_14925 [Planctomyces sp. SH-PL14]
MSQIAGSILIVGAALVHMMERAILFQHDAAAGLGSSIRMAGYSIAKVNGSVGRQGIGSPPEIRYIVWGLAGVGAVLLLAGFVLDLRRLRGRDSSSS